MCSKQFSAASQYRSFCFRYSRRNGARILLENCRSVQGFPTSIASVGRWLVHEFAPTKDSAKPECAVLRDATRVRREFSGLPVMDVHFLVLGIEEVCHCSCLQNSLIQRPCQARIAELYSAFLRTDEFCYRQLAAQALRCPEKSHGWTNGLSRVPSSTTQSWRCRIEKHAEAASGFSPLHQKLSFVRSSCFEITSLTSPTRYNGALHRSAPLLTSRSEVNHASWHSVFLIFLDNESP